MPVRSLLAALLLSLCAAASPRAFAQNESPTPMPIATPQDLGFAIDEFVGKSKPGGGRLALVPIEGSSPKVGRVLCATDTRSMVMLPDGALKVYTQNELTTTERPFVPATKKELTESLKKKFPGFNIRETKHFVFVYNTSQAFYVAASRILETMYPGLLSYCKRSKIETREQDVPLVAVMFSTEDEFQKFRAMPAGVAAYYNVMTNQILMYEQSRLGVIAPELAIKSSISTIAHEGVHQILANIGVHQRLLNWPIWAQEGLAEYFAPTSIDHRVRWKGVGVPHDLRIKELYELSKASNLPPDGELIKGIVRARGLTSTGYAISWALTHYLAERRKKEFFAYLASVSKLPPLEETTPDESEKLFTAQFGDDFAKIQREVFTHVERLPYVDPVLNMTYYVGMFQLRTGNIVNRKVMTTSSLVALEQWRQQEVNALPPSAQANAAFEVQAFAGRPAAEEFILSLRAR